MKNILKLIFLGIVIAVGWNYLYMNNINVREKFLEYKEIVQNKLQEISDESANSPQEVSGNVSSDYQNEKEPSGEYIQNVQSMTSGQSAGNEETEENSPPESETGFADQPVYDDDHSHAESTVPGSMEENMEWVKSMTEKYSPDSWYMLMEYDRLPARAKATGRDGSVLSTQKSAGTFHYLSGNRKSELLHSMATNVHEISHGYLSLNCYHYSKEKNIALNWDNAEGYFFLSPRLSYFISFPHKSLFPSKELVPEIPENLRTFRFETYVNGVTSTQGDGIVGLLDELHAYYLGSKYSFEMLDAYELAEGSEAKGLLEWMSNTQSSMTAYYEFNFFMMEYLLHMKKTRPADYAALKSYRVFVDAYASTRKLFKELISRYQQKIQSEAQRINASGEAEISIKNNNLWVKEAGDNSRKGSFLFSDDREKLMIVFESGRYDEITNDFGNL